MPPSLQAATTKAAEIIVENTVTRDLDEISLEEETEQNFTMNAFRAENPFDDSDSSDTLTPSIHRVPVTLLSSATSPTLGVRRRV